MPFPLLLAGAASLLAKTGIGKKIVGGVVSKVGGAVGRLVSKRAVQTVARTTGKVIGGTATGYGAYTAVRDVRNAFSPQYGEMPFGGMGGGIVPQGPRGLTQGRGAMPFAGAAPVPAGRGKSTIPPDAWARPDGANVLPAQYLRPYYRAPKGYVVVHLSDGSVVGVAKPMARYYGAWKPQPKPPISVGDWHKFKAARQVEKKLRKIAGPALRRHSKGSACKGKKR